MSWLLLALIAPLFNAINNVIDQLLTRLHFPDNGEVLLFIGALTYLVILPVLYLYIPQGQSASLSDIAWLIGLGVLTIILFMPYFWALERYDVTMVMPIMQLAPVYVFILAYIFLGETVGPTNLVGAAITIFASMAIVSDWKARSIHWKPLVYIAAASFGMGIQTFGIRVFVSDLHWTVVSFWLGVGFCLVGIGALTFIKSYRSYAIQTVRETRGAVFAVIGLQEIFFYIFILMTVVALSTAPSAGLVRSVLGVLPAYILVLSAIFQKFFPENFENLGFGKVFWWRLSCILAMFIGVFLIYT